MTPKISVIIPHYNDLAALALCLADLEKQSYPRNNFEIIVGDNASPVEYSALEAVVLTHAALVIVTERGAGPARNGAAALAKGGILAFIDSDCRPSPGWLDAGVAMLETTCVVGGKVTVPIDKPGKMSGAEAFEAVFAFNQKDYIEHKGFTGSGNLFVHTNNFERIGGFCVGKSEDNEWSYRAVAAGLKIKYAPDALVCHPARRNWQELHKKWKRISHENYLLISEQRFGKLKWLFRTWAMPLSALAHTPRVLASRLLSGGEKRRALVTLYKLRLWRFMEGNRLLLTDGR